MPEVLLRDVSETDLEAFFEHQRDPAATRMAAFPSRDREEFMAHWAKITRDGSCLTKTIVFDGHVAGNVGSWQASDGRAVGYWLGREHWGKGVATRALSLFLRFETTRPLRAHVAKHNLGSLRVLQKCGFTISGEARIESGVSLGEIDEFVLTLAV
jgi:RimJ/RimL family protein N-acetyltransferase